MDEYEDTEGDAVATYCGETIPDLKGDDMRAWLHSVADSYEAGYEDGRSGNACTGDSPSYRMGHKAGNTALVVILRNQ